MTNRKLAPVLVGQLLVESGMLDKDLLQIALDRAHEMGVKIGQILLYTGLVCDQYLKAALSAQRMLRQQLISFKQAVEALGLVKEQKMPYETALARARWLNTSEQVHQFAKLLMDAGLLSTEELGNSLALAIRNGYCLGRVLVLHGKINMEIRKAALDAIILTRCGEITYGHAVAAMKAFLRTGHGIRVLLGLEASPVSVLSHELIDLGVLTEYEVVDVIEDALQRDTLWKGNMVGTTLVANLKFAASLAINRMVADGHITLFHAQTLCRELLLSTAAVLANLSQQKQEIQMIA
ncbi:MAG: hypothetical protein K2X81_12795 [Candidatus Obscuribacterales bacterium]|nr:hypothetical protein [Candidatus Obscuribacterales bacterium]